MRVVLTIDNCIVELLAEDNDIAIRIARSDLIARRLTTLAPWPLREPRLSGALVAHLAATR
jgi:hypothetical protein